MQIHPPGLHLILCCLLLIFARTTVAAGSLTGHPAQIISGNELILLGSDGAMHRVKLSGIDTQPPNRPWGAAARRQLQMLVMGRSVTLVYPGTGRAQEIRGQLRHGGADINMRLLSAGLARLDPAGLSRAQAERYAEAEQRARTAGLGIWGTTGSQGKIHPETQQYPGSGLR